MSGTGALRVLYLIDGLGPGGAERSLAELLPAYLASSVRTLVVCLSEHRTAVSAKVRDLGCDIRVLPEVGFATKVRLLRQMIRDEKPDLIHTTLYKSDIIGRVAAAGTGVPVLTSLVNTTYEPARRHDPNVGRLGLWATQAIDGWTARRLTDHFHAITDAVKQSNVRSLGIPAERVTVIERGRSGVRLGRGGPARRAAARQALGIPDDAEVVVNLARQEYQKGQRHLLEALRLLMADRPRLRVLIAGRDGHASAELAELRERLGLGDRVWMLGNREDVPELLAAADLFAFPSLYEGLGGALIEAMALGLPIVASDIPAVREVVEDGGNALLVPPASGEALADAIARLLDDQATRGAYAARSREIFESRFTIERSAERMIQLYRKVSSLARAGSRTTVQPSGNGTHVVGASPSQIEP